MTIEEYFGDWSEIVDLPMVNDIMKKLMPIRNSICPDFNDIFKAFRLCPLNDVRCIILGQDPYPNIIDGQPVATGIAFGNRSETPEEKLSPSLDVLRESIINFSLPHKRIIFDASLESLEGQGILLLNTALTCLRGKPGSHMLLWHPFITSLLTRLAKEVTAIVYVLMGSQAQALSMYIDQRNNYIVRCRHPSYYARTHEKMPDDIWREINNILTGIYGYGVEWYKEV